MRPTVSAILIAIFCTLIFGARMASAGFFIDLGDISSMTASQQSAFNSAKATWENLITDYQPNSGGLTGLTIKASIMAIDGAGGILGQAGPTSGITAANGFTYATVGIMEFDSADVANLESNGSFTSVILHEMAHVIGFGTLWTHNNVYVNNSGQFTGANALASYRTEFNQPTAAFVPVELGGGVGTRNGHWDESDGGGANTGRQTIDGKDMRFELMTGWLNSPAFISNTTVMSFQDIGYITAVPEPSSYVLLAVGLSGFWVSRRLRKQHPDRSLA